eukprot:COSAG04_NODE_104_length_26097_cov_12.466074_8_plen_56_part_00
MESDAAKLAMIHKIVATPREVSTETVLNDVRRLVAEMGGTQKKALQLKIAQALFS